MLSAASVLSNTPRGLSVFDSPNNNPYAGIRTVKVPRVDAQGRIIPGKFIKYRLEDFLIRRHGRNPNDPRLPNFFKKGRTEIILDSKGNPEIGRLGPKTRIIPYKTPQFLNPAQEEFLFGHAKRREEKKESYAKLREEKKERERAEKDAEMQEILRYQNKKRNRTQRGSRKQEEEEEDEEEEGPPPQKYPRQATKMFYAVKQAQESEGEDEDWGGEGKDRERQQELLDEAANLKLAMQEAREMGAAREREGAGAGAGRRRRSRSRSKSPSPRGAGAGAGARRRSRSPSPRGAGAGAGARRRSRSSQSRGGAAAKRKRSRSRSRSRSREKKGRGSGGKRKPRDSGGEGRIKQKRVSTRGKCYRDMSCVFDDGEQIKHTRPVDGDDWIGIYHRSRNVIHRLKDYENPTQFALAHIHEMNPNRPSVNGWSKCLVKRGSEWIKIKRLRCKHCLDREEEDGNI